MANAFLEAPSPEGGPVRPSLSEAPPAIKSAAVPVEDVWSRTAPKYRFRAVALLVVNMVLFSGLCVFTHWLHVGRLFDFSWSSYAEPGRFWGEQTRTLNDFILYPISVEQVPVHGVVLGLLVASIVAVPIVTAILYRFPFALPFIAAVAVFAHMPWMAFTLLWSCILAGVKPFRMSFRFGSALVGMLPVLAYLYLAARGASDQASTFVAPAQKSLLVAPWALAILAACAMMGTILLIARVVNYRPGAITPVVTVMFATPMILFHARVGADELTYRVLETEYGPASPRFEPVRDASETWESIRLLMQRWTTEDDATAPFRPEIQAIWGGQVDPLKQRIVQSFMLEFLADRAAAYTAAKRFIAIHPASRYLPNALYIQGLVMDTRLDERRLRETPPRRELYSDFPHAQSEAAWSALLSQYPASPLAIPAGYRLALLKLRRGEIDAAMELLSTVACRDSSGAANPQTQPAVRGLFVSAPPESSLKLDPRPYLFEAQHLGEVISANRDDPRHGNEPLKELAAIDPHRPASLQESLNLYNRYRDSTLADNLAVSWAAALADQDERAARLAECIDFYPDGDALPEALFRLADIEIQGARGKDEAMRTAGLARLEDVVARFGATCWGQAAAERLNMIRPAAAMADGLTPR